MQLKNSNKGYGLIAVLLHWIPAFIIVFLFVLGLWMVELDYYSSWYKTAPHIHKSLGILLLAAMLFRIVWRVSNPKPEFESGMSSRERMLAEAVHRGLYMLVFFTAIAGYLISTADGRAVEVFNWFEMPALISGIEGQEDVAGKVHYILALLLISVAALHALAALKHHFFDKDNTLKKILGLI